MVEFLRLKLITGDDLSTTLQTWKADMEATTEEFLRDLDSVIQTSTALPSQNAAVEAALHKYREVAKLKLALPLTQLDAAHEEMEKFIQFCIEELQSQQETMHLVGELSSRITDHQSRVCQLLRSKPLRHPKVVPLILVGMAADWPLESNFFPGLFEGLLGRLGIAAPGESKPPTSSREGAGHLWSSAMHEAISQIEQREVETPGTARLPQCLDLHYEEDFLEKQSHQVPVVFSDLLFVPNMANMVYKVFKPPVVPKMFPSASSRRFHPSRVSQRMTDLNQGCLNQRSPPRVPQSPVNRSRSESLRLPTLTRIRPMSLPQRRNSLLKVSKSKSPINSGNVAVRP